jgi:hypothetical protein
MPWLEMVFLADQDTIFEKIEKNHPLNGKEISRLAD